MQYLEDYYPPARDGVNTQKNVTIGGNLSVTGTITGPRKANVVSGSGATVALSASQSGATCLFDRAAGIVYTLPAPQVGLTFDFVTTVSVTSNSDKVITDAGTTFLIGPLQGLNTASSNAALSFVGNGSSHLAVTQAAASTNATGGLQGSWINFKCVSSTLWEVSGVYLAGTTATSPFATS